jgi:hypothetical protein
VASNPTSREELLTQLERALFHVDVVTDAIATDDSASAAFDLAEAASALAGDVMLLLEPLVASEVAA